MPPRRGALYSVFALRFSFVVSEDPSCRRIEVRLMTSICSESIWALRNVRARGWRAVLAAGLLAVALAANLLIFSAADSLVFHRVPYQEPARLVRIARQDPRYGERGDFFLSPALLDEWRKQTDVFSGVHGYLTK